MDNNSQYGRSDRPKTPYNNQRKPMSWPASGTGAADLIKTNYRILIDAGLLDTPGFRAFYREWMNDPGRSDRKQLFVSALDVTDTAVLASYAEVKLLRYTDCADYLTFFQIVKKMGSWIYLTTEDRNPNHIFSASRESKIFLRVYGVNSQGKLCNCASPARSTRPASAPAVSANAFVLTDQIAPVRKVTRRSLRVPVRGDTVFTSGGSAIRLRDEFISNPQSITYQTDAAGLQAKIYQPQWLAISYFEDKVKLMLQKPVKCEGICWPIDLLRNAEGEFVGILVPAAEGYQLKQQMMSQQGLEEHFPSWDRRKLTHLAKVIMEKIEILQQHNVIFGLVNPAAIFVKDEDHVFFAEMDTYQIEGFPILSYERVLQAPELQDVPGGMRLYTRQQDNYGIALLAFMILMPGKFPYNKGGNKDISESIKNMSFAFHYGKRGEEHGTRESFGSWRFVWSHLGNDLRQAFYNTFQRDQFYSLPEKRKDAGFWRRRIADLEKELIDPYDKESQRLFPRTFKRHGGTRTIRCIKCGIDHPDFYYRFPQKQICNSCLGKPSPTHFECKSCNKSFYYDFATLFKYQELVAKKDFVMPTHCPYCRSDKRKCTECEKLVPAYRLNDDGVCIDCRNKIATTYYCRCGNVISLTKGQYDFHMKKFGRLPQRCDRCKSDRRSRY